LKVINQFLFSLLHLLFVFVKFSPQNYSLIFYKKNFFVLIFHLSEKNDAFGVVFSLFLPQIWLKTGCFLPK